MAGFAEGGAVSGPGTGTSDSIIARLSNGKFVVRAKAVAKYGVGLLNGLNSMSFPSSRLPAFADGGLVGATAGGAGMSLVIGGKAFETSASKSTVDDLRRHTRHKGLARPIGNARWQSR
jgi:hypothetical protein